MKVVGPAEIAAADPAAPLFPTTASSFFMACAPSTPGCFSPLTPSVLIFRTVVDCSVFGLGVVVVVVDVVDVVVVVVVVVAGTCQTNKNFIVI